MVWYFSAHGYAKAVADAAARDFASCSVDDSLFPIRQNIAGTIALVLGAFPPEMPVKIIAGAGQPGDSPICRVNLEIQPMWDFLKNLTRA